MLSQILLFIGLDIFAIAQIGLTAMAVVSGFVYYSADETTRQTEDYKQKMRGFDIGRNVFFLLLLIGAGLITLALK